MKTQLGTIECALAELFDYAGMFPPAQLDLRAALRDYLEHRRCRHAWALGSFVVDAHNLSALCEAAGDAMRDMRLSVLATAGDVTTIEKHLEEGLPIEAVEVKIEDRDSIPHWKGMVSAGIAVYVEAPLKQMDSIDASGMHAKVRMGGMTAEAIPAAASVAAALKKLADRRMAFKATAGLHHPLRARHALTYKPDSPAGVMHGFMNLLGASALVWFGGEEAEAAQLLDEQDPHAWHVTADSIRWRSRSWNAIQLREVRECFLRRIGSCSFTEPMHELEALGWL